MYFQSKQIARDLVKLADSCPGKEFLLVEKFIQFAKEKGIEAQLQNILKHIELIISAKRHMEELTIASHDKLSDQLIEAIKKYIKTDNSATVNQIENKSVIGGFIAEYDGKIFDGSINNQLQKIKQKFAA
ncbi:MAG: F0F1 ATP synthase subunit delta [Candidatus Kuenenbacteria bacterium]